MNAKKRQKAKKDGFTHIGSIYGYECFLAHTDLPDGQISVEIRGTSWFRRRMINFFAWIETRVYPVNNGFIIIEDEEL
jgi:hypothetical protein